MVGARRSRTRRRWRIGLFDVAERFEAVEERSLTGEDVPSSERKSKPRRAIDFGNLKGAAASWRPSNCDFMAAHGSDVLIAFQRIGQDPFCGTLAHFPKRLQRDPVASTPSSSANPGALRLPGLHRCPIRPSVSTMRQDRGCAKKGPPGWTRRTTRPASA